jgi:hypothetical protein
MKVAIATIGFWGSVVGDVIIQAIAIFKGQEIVEDKLPTYQQVFVLFTTK